MRPLGASGAGTMVRKPGLHGWVEAVGDGITLLLLKVALVPGSDWQGLRATRDDGLEGAQVDTKDDPPAWKDLTEGSVMFVWNLLEEAGKHTDDKLKLLLTLSASLATGVVMIGRGIEAAIPWTAGVAALICTAYLCLAALGVRTYWTPTPGAKQEKGDWIRDVYSCYIGNDDGQRVRVGLLRGARRWFLGAMLLIALSGATAHQQVSKLEASARSIEMSLTRLVALPSFRVGPAHADSLFAEVRSLRTAVESLAARQARKGR